MTRTDAARRADVLEAMLGSLAGAFPGPLLEALIARLEAGK